MDRSECIDVRIKSGLSLFLETGKRDGLSEETAFLSVAVSGCAREHLYSLVVAMSKAMGTMGKCLFVREARLVFTSGWNGEQVTLALPLLIYILGIPTSTDHNPDISMNHSATMNWNNGTESVEVYCY